MRDIPATITKFINTCITIFPYVALPEDKPGAEPEPSSWVHIHAAILPAPPPRLTNLIEAAISMTMASYKEKKGLGENGANLITELFPQFINAIFTLAKKNPGQINSKDLIILSNDQRFFIQNQDTNIYLCNELPLFHEEVIYESVRLTSYDQINNLHSGPSHPSHHDYQNMPRHNFVSDFHNAPPPNWQYLQQSDSEIRHSPLSSVSPPYHTRSFSAYQNQLRQLPAETQQDVLILDEIAREIASNSSNYLRIAILSNIRKLFGNTACSVRNFITFFGLLPAQDPLFLAVRESKEFNTIFPQIFISLISLLKDTHRRDIEFFNCSDTTGSCFFVRKCTDNKIYLFHRKNKQETQLMVLMENVY